MIFNCLTCSRTQSDTVGQIERFRVVKELCVSEAPVVFPSKEVFLVYRQPRNSALAGNFVYNWEAESLGRIKSQTKQSDSRTQDAPARKNAAEKVGQSDSRTVGQSDNTPPAKTPPKKSDSRTVGQSDSRTTRRPPRNFCRKFQPAHMPRFLACCSFFRLI